MKSKVQLSGYAFILTLVITIVLAAICILTFNETPAFLMVLGILVLLLVFGLIYGPVYITANPDYVSVRSVLKTRKIPVADIESVELFQPTMGAYRLFASGGYFGYWGLFREGDIGKYYAYYGKASDCFLLRMKNGDKYVLGCTNPSSMTAYINSLLTPGTTPYGK